MVTHPSILAWRIPGTGSLVGCRLWGRTESDTTEVMQQQQQCSIYTGVYVYMEYTIDKTPYVKRADHTLLVRSPATWMVSTSCPR